MDGKPIQIIKTHYENNKLKFDLDFDQLKAWVEPIKNKEVALISVVGPTQTGRSALLNLIGHKLSNKGIEELITGFESRPDVDPVTSGLWLSKPIITKKNDGKELAIILLDSQSVFDGNTSVEDSNKIVWICLLLSSCLIVNLFSQLSEEFLQKFYPFVESMNSGFAQNLIFMIRDWNKTELFRYGYKGGQQYLDNRLQLRDNSSFANKTRRSLKKCFKQIDCYLMPNFYLNEDLLLFAKSLSPAFNGCLQEVFNESFILFQKEINNSKFITGSELCQFFKVYVELFNSTEQPNHTAIRTATTETSDLILIEKIKNQHWIQLKTFISLKTGFVSRKSLIDYCSEISGDFEKLFRNEKKSEYSDVGNLYKTLCGYFDSNRDKAIEENAKNRKQHIQRILKNCQTVYKLLLEEDFDENKFYNSNDLTKLFDDHRKVVDKTFKDSFYYEDKEVFIEESQNLDQYIKSLENEFRTENEKRMAELGQEKNTRAVGMAIEYYDQKMQNFVALNQFITDEQFSEMEEIFKKKSRLLFLEKCTFGDSQFIDKFDKDFRKRISHLKYKFIEEMKKSREIIVDNIDIDLIDKFEELKKLDVKSKEEIEQETLKIKEVFTDKFKYYCLPEEVFNCFNKKLESGINTFVGRYNDTLISTILEEAKNFYTQGMGAEINVNPNCNLNEINNLSKDEAFAYLRMNMDKLHLSTHENYKLNQELENFIDKKFVEYKNSFFSTLEKILSNCIWNQKTEDYHKEYESRMRDEISSHMCEVDGEITENEFMVKHNVVKSEVIQSFENKCKGSDSFGSFVSILAQMIEKSCEELFKPFQVSTEVPKQIPDQRPDRSTYVTEEEEEKYIRVFEECFGRILTYKDDKQGSKLTDQRPKPTPESTEKGKSLAKIIELKSDGKFQLNEELLSSIVSKAENCTNFAFISIIGRKYSSKTFLINCLKNYLESNNRKRWPKNCRFTYEEGFRTDFSNFSLKPVVQIWEPFIIESKNQRTAVFLMDSSNVFIDISEMSNTGSAKEIIELFLNISSTVILMTESKLLTKEIETLKTIIEENVETASTDKFQELICVLCDNSNSSDPKSGEILANQLVSDELNKYFENQSCYVMPSPGKYHIGKNVVFDCMSDQFLVKLSNLFRKNVLNIDVMPVKKDLVTDEVLEPNQLNILFQTQVNKLNGVIEPEEMTDSGESLQMCDSSSSINVMEQEDSDECQDFWADSGCGRHEWEYTDTEW